MNREHRREYGRAWRAANPGYMREYMRSRNGYYDKVVCAEAECRRKPYREGLCSKHALPVVRHRAAECVIEDCGKATRRERRCQMHASRHRKGQRDCETFGCLRIGYRGGFCYEHEPARLEYRDCRDCGSLYVCRAGHARRSFCSDECSTRSARRSDRQRRRAGGGERIVARKVYERDGWRCGLCRRAIDSNLVYPHPRSASLDHIVPLTRGGSHSWSNVQAAHFRCNVDKGNRVYGDAEQLRLIA